MILLLASACRSPSHREAQPAASSPAPSTLWVDAAGAEPGDGSRERPLRQLGEALARPGALTVRVAPGRYTGPFLIPPGVRVEGQGPGVVLQAEGAARTVIQVGEDAELSDFVVQGGLWGVESMGGGHVRLARVGFRGQVTGAVRVEAGRLDVEDSRFEAAPAAMVGVLLESGRAPSPESGEQSAPRDASPKPEVLSNTDGSMHSPQDSEAATGAGAQQEDPRHAGAIVEAHIRGSTFTGPYRRAVRLRGADVRATLEDLQFTGAATAVGVDGAYAEVRRSTAEGGQAAAFSVMDGTLILDEVSVTGHEYGVSSMQARRLDVHRFTSVRAIRAGMGLLMSCVRLRDIVVRDSGAYGGLQFSGGDLDVQGVRVDGAAEYGVMALRGKLRLRDVDIRRVRTADGVTGDGLHLRQVEADVEGVVVRDAQGACVLAAQNARVSLRGAKLETCGYVGLLTDTLARMNAVNVDIQGAATALGALGNGELRVESLSASGLETGFVHAECEGATQVHLKEFRSEDTRGLSARCVHASPK
ncbi:hypothetical protein [Myxococcus xanthus]|uniref:hypothetical protein n=1 Tax=Myxococcus xanthus TaxID=34 RepID=UPI00210B7FB5|nr:hypothetical protein [Myxococcus xanthus]